MVILILARRQSIRSASPGSIEAARFAGIAADIIAAAHSTRPTATSTTGSFRLPIDHWATTLLSPTLNARPATRPAKTARTAGRTAALTMRPRPAPSAIRMPNSLNRHDTEYDTTL